MNVIKPLAIAATLIATLASAKADDLSAQITQLQKANSQGTFRALLVVTNSGNRQYRMTRWSCAFRNKNNELVGEDSTNVYNILPNSQTPLRWLPDSFDVPASSECRLLDSELSK